MSSVTEVMKSMVRGEGVLTYVHHQPKYISWDGERAMGVKLNTIIRFVTSKLGQFYSYCVGTQRSH